MSVQEKIDWSECPLVEIKPGVQSGASVLRGTRMPTNAIVDNFDYGMSVSEIAEQLELPPDRVRAIRCFWPKIGGDKSIRPQPKVYYFAA